MTLIKKLETLIFSIMQLFNENTINHNGDMLITFCLRAYSTMAILNGNINIYSLNQGTKD
jgi:hypothetical protein